MAYTPTNWVTGDTVTATKLNKLEQGVANAGGGGYDAEVYIYHDNVSAHDYECTIISGTFDDLASKISDNEFPMVLFHIWDDMTGAHVVALGWLYNWFINTEHNFITFHAFQPCGITSNNGLGYIVWDDNDNITI